jgi:hypothetical protein
MKINNSKVSDRAWGSVDKSALGQKLADGYAAGEVTKAQIREVYAFVPEDAFTTDAEGKPKFLASKAWGPHHEISGGEIVLNRDGLAAAAGALAGARSEPGLSSGEKATAMAHIRGHYRAEKMPMPAGMKENEDSQPQINADERGLGKEARRKGKRIEERDGSVELEEAQDGAARRIRAKDVIIAGVVNGNDRRYPASVVSSAAAELSGHLNESAGQGRAIQILGEAEHPTDKGGHPSMLETVVKWDQATFDGRSLALSGSVLATSKGRDILALMEGGVLPGVSLRGYGEIKSIKEDGKRIEEVTELHLTGFDLVLEPSFREAAAMLESKQGDDEMTPEEILKVFQEHPELFTGITEAQVTKMGEAQLKAMEETLREKLGIDGKADIAKALTDLTEKARRYDENERKGAVEAAIAEATKDLPYGKHNAQFVEAIRAANPQDAAAVKSLVETKRKEYDALFAELQIKKMGGAKAGIQTGSVLEEETGQPEFARAAFEITESVRKASLTQRRDFRTPKSPNEAFTALVLERFDRLYMRQLLAESSQFQEAEETSDLNLPYSVSRAIIAEAFPTLVATGLIDVGVIETSPTKLFYETFAGETGYSDTVSGETVAADLDVWVKLDFGRITPGTVAVSGYDEHTDFVIDYAGGRLKALTTGDISDNESLSVDYSYTAIRNGEMIPIERGKLTLASKTVEAAADRLADQISSEAMVFSRSQLGWDATARTMASLINQVRRKIDQGILYAAWSAVKSVVGNEAGSWTTAYTQDDYDELARLIGVAKVQVAKRFYQATFILASATNADILTNWKGVSADGFPDATLSSSGFLTGVKGLPVYSSTEFPDTEILVANRQLVMHRILQPLTVKGPYPTYDVSGGTSKLVAADQYYTEEYNLTDAPVPEKGSYVTIAPAAS